MDGNGEKAKRFNLGRMGLGYLVVIGTMVIAWGAFSGMLASRRLTLQPCGCPSSGSPASSLAITSDLRLATAVGKRSNGSSFHPERQR